MTAIQVAVEGAGTSVSKTAWSAFLSSAEQNAQAQTAAATSTHIKLTVRSDVVSCGVADNDVTEDLNTWRVGLLESTTSATGSSSRSGEGY